ncbi:MAG: hypothetical protein ACRBN8_23400 [Nannocystales bacterium]
MLPASGGVARHTENVALLQANAPPPADDDKTAMVANVRAAFSELDTN